MTDNPRTPHTRSRAGVIGLAAATATVLGATAFALPAEALSGSASGTASGSGGAASGAKAAAGIPLKNGTLDWGIKKSFRDYLTGPIANGEITVADGAKTNADGSFRFTDGTGSYDGGKPAVTTAFKGSVHLYGHEGKLDLKLSGLKVVTEGTTGSLSADIDTGTGEDGKGKPEKSEDDVELAALDLTDINPGKGSARNKAKDKAKGKAAGGEMTFADIPASLTEEGSEAFEKYYPAGEKLDPVSLTVTPASASGGTGGSADGGKAGSADGGSASPGSSGASRPTGSTGSSGPASGGSGDGGNSGASGPAGSDEEKPASGEIADGTLDWGVKKSFRTYVTGPIAHGKIEVSDGAETTKSGYRFSKGGGDYQPGDLNAAFEGGVRFLGHKESGSYTLDLALSHFRVEAAGTKGKLVADVRSKDRKTGKVHAYDGLAVASLTLKSGALDPEKDVVSLKSVPATLTEDGAKAFGGFYEKGEKLDPVTAAVSLDESAELPGADGGSGSGPGSGGTEPASAGGAATVGGTGETGALASTGTGLPSASLMGGALTLAALGGAAVYTARRRERGSTPNES